MTAPLLIRPGTSDQNVFRAVYFDEVYKPSKPVDAEIVLDLGAYTGISTRYFQSLWPNATVIAVEPDPRSATLLRLNAPGAEIHEVAVYHENKLTELSLHDEPWKTSMGLWLDGTNIHVAGVAVKDILAGRQPQVVKIDIEGAERFVFNGDTSWLSGVKVLFVETHDRFVEGCSEALYTALEAQSRNYTVENRGGEDLMITFGG